MRQLARDGMTMVIVTYEMGFARDAATLAEGGYRLESVTPVDQFLWSPHIELTGLFRR